MSAKCRLELKIVSAEFSSSGNTEVNWCSGVVAPTTVCICVCKWTSDNSAGFQCNNFQKIVIVSICREEECHEKTDCSIICKFSRREATAATASIWAKIHCWSIIIFIHTWVPLKKIMVFDIENTSLSLRQSCRNNLNPRFKLSICQHFISGTTSDVQHSSTSKLHALHKVS